MIVLAKDRVNEPCYGIVPVFNPWRWKSRVKHTERAIKHFHDSGLVIVLVEVAFNRRDFVFQDSGLDGMLASCGIGGEHRHKWVGLRTTDELWLKENAINLGAQQLPHNWQNMCWLDSDVHFARPNWVGQIVHQLQHYKFVQPFTQARDLGPNYEMLPEDYPHASGIGFAHAWKEGFLKSTLTPEIRKDLEELKGDIRKLIHDFIKLEKDLSGGHCYPDRRVFPGLAWACSRQAWDEVGGMLDVAIWGGGDWHMSHALIEKTEMMMRNDLHRNYKKKVNQWYQRCRTHIRQNVGVVEGAIFHNWHGKKIGRGYNTKHQLLAEYGFDPERHLKRDSQGLYQLHDDRSTSFVKLRDMMRSIAKDRNEDSIDI